MPKPTTFTGEPIDTISKNGRSSKSHTSRRNIIKYLLIATIAFGGCDKPGGKEPDDPGNGENGNGNGNGNGEKPVLVEDKRSNSSVKILIENYLSRRIPNRNYETDEELTADAVAYVNRVLFVGNKDTVSNKLAKVGFSAGKVSNNTTFDHVTPYVEVTTGNCTDREGTSTVIDPYDPYSRSFSHQYEISCKENE